MNYAYVNQPVLPPGVVPALAPRQKRAKRRRAWRWLLSASVLLLAVSGGVLWHSLRVVSPIPAAVQRAAGFPLYYPAWLPPGAHIDPASFDVTSQVVTFTVSYDHGKKLLLSEQLKPTQFDFDTFYNQQLTAKKTFSTPAGSVTTGQFDAAPFASLVADRTWLLLNAPGGIDSSQFEHVLRAVRR